MPAPFSPRCKMSITDILIMIIEVVIIPFCVWLAALIWKKIIKPVAKMVKGHDYLVCSIKEIKHELTTNGGSSIKDAINRIESRQITVDHRSKAIFYNFEQPIFEISNAGDFLWSNEKFKEATDHKEFKGLDWVNIVDEPERHHVLHEFESCSKGNREIKIKTVSMDGTSICLHGFPYRGEKKNHGFLVYLKIGE